MICHLNNNSAQSNIPTSGPYSVYTVTCQLYYNSAQSIIPTSGPYSVALHFNHRNISIMVLINTGTTSKLNPSIMPPSSSTNPAIFTQFSSAHRINPKEWKRIGVFYYFLEQFHIFKGNFTKLQDKWPYFKIAGVFKDKGQIQGLFAVCANPVNKSSAHSKIPTSCHYSVYTVMSAV